jgi:hypothetical protein
MATHNNPHNTLLATPTGAEILKLVIHPQKFTRMIELSGQGHPAVGALTDLPADLPNRYKRLAGHLVKRVMLARGYVQVPGWPSRIPGPSAFKRGARFHPGMLPPRA